MTITKVVFLESNKCLITPNHHLPWSGFNLVNSRVGVCVYTQSVNIPTCSMILCSVVHVCNMWLGVPVSVHLSPIPSLL